MRWLKIARQTF